MLTKEDEDLLYMWEEEKMAHDFYLKMFEKYRKRIFSNITESEKRHMNAIKHLMNERGISTPVDEKEIGFFKNPEMARHYEELLQSGHKSLYDAYEAGLTLEKADIVDLDERIKRANTPQVRQVLGNLKEASYRHKDSLEKHLSSKQW
jgi:hypothetical protein